MGKLEKKVSFCKIFCLIFLLFLFNGKAIFAESSNEKNQVEKNQVLNDSASQTSQSPSIQIESLNAEKSNSTSLSEDSIIISLGDSETSTSYSSEKKSSNVKLFLRMIIVLIIVVVLIYFVLWFIKKKTNIVKNEDDYLRRVAYINIAPGKTVEVITLIDKGYLIGVTEDNITLLGEIEDKELISAMNLSADKKTHTTKPVNFSQVLDMFLLKGNKKTNIFKDSEEKIYSSKNESENSLSGEQR